MTDEWCGRLDDDDGPMVTVIDSEQQALMVRVGPVYIGDEQIQQPGIWIEYQEEYLAKPCQGPVLMSREIWDALVEAVNARLADYEL